MRALKRLLPFLLCLVVIASIGWYLLIYDQNFTQELLLGSARFFESQGNHSVATWFYNKAYHQSGNDDDVIIELAQRFKDSGNYTQAEVVLTNAIAENATTNLYIALSKTYVEQDKLLDASNMLRNILDPKIKAELNAMRPSAPVANPQPGFYNQYINIDLQSPGQTPLYITTDGDFPSVNDRYDNGVTLVAGENKIQAIAVSENGLVSEPAHFSYIVVGVIEEINISDPILDQAFRQILGISDGQKILTSDLWKITSLTVPEGVTNIQDLAYLTYLETLVTENLAVEDFQMLSSLKELKNLAIRGSVVSAKDLEVISNLPRLENLVLSNCSLINIEGLANAKQLLTLDLSGNAIADLTPLSFMSALTTLDLKNNAITDLSPLSAMMQLTTLDVSYNSLTSLAPLSTCSSLSGLIATNNQLKEIPVFMDPTVLTILAVQNNQLTNVSNLVNYTNLTGLNISYNKIKDITALGSLNNLVSIDFSNNQVSTLPTWGADSMLVILNGSYNKISSVTPLAGLPCLNQVILDYNRIKDVDDLAKCYLLARVDIYGNKVKDVSKLKAMSVIVNYDPT